MARESTVDMRPQGDAPSRHHWTVDEYYRAINAGMFDQPGRLELIDGEIVEKTGQNPPHATLLSRLARRLRRVLEPRFCVRDEKPVRLADDLEPIPDIMVLKGTDEEYEYRHPDSRDTLLIVEVSDASSAYDTRDKAGIYARSGITDYWILLIKTREILVMRTPEKGSYQDVVRVSGDETLSPLAAPDVVFLARELFE